MNEKMYEGENPEQQKQREQQERYEQWMKDHPDAETSPETLRENTPEIAELEEMFAAFESNHSLAELNLIIDLTPQEAPNHPVRGPARVALIPIVAKLNALKRETTISSEKYEELMMKYKRLSRAVGIINSNKVDHTR